MPTSTDEQQQPHPESAPAALDPAPEGAPTPEAAEAEAEAEPELDEADEPEESESDDQPPDAQDAPDAQDVPSVEAESPVIGSGDDSSAAPAVPAEAPAPAPIAFGDLTPNPDVVAGVVGAPSRFPRLSNAASRIGRNARDVQVSVVELVERGRTAVLAERRNARIAAAGGIGVVVTAVVLAVTLGSGPSTSSAADSVSRTDGHPAGTTPSATSAPRPSLRLTVPDSLTVPGHLALAWPATGQAAIAVPGVGLLGSSGPVDTPKPIASVTKTMTAYVILKDHPLAPGQPGPILTITAAQAAALPGEEALHQSLVPVRTGERFTERQALQALMLASADNMAQILASWDSGSESRFVARMNAAAASLGMTHSHFTQASGYLGTSVSTATDLVKLGESAITDAFFADLVDETSAVIPGGAIHNYNALLGQNGVDGIKTGSTYWAGGCLLFSAHTRVAGHEVTLVGAVLGQPGNISTMLPSVFAATARLLRSADHALKQVTVVGQGRTVAELSGLSGVRRSPQLLSAGRAVTLVGWPGLRLRLRLSGSAARPALRALTPDGRTAATTPLVSGRSE